jgi:hypothetical protein
MLPQLAQYLIENGGDANIAARAAERAYDRASRSQYLPPGQAEEVKATSLKIWKGAMEILATQPEPDKKSPHYLSGNHSDRLNFMGSFTVPNLAKDDPMVAAFDEAMKAAPEVVRTAAKAKMEETAQQQALWNRPLSKNGQKLEEFKEGQHVFGKTYRELEMDPNEYASTLKADEEFRRQTAIEDAARQAKITKVDTDLGKLADGGFAKLVQEANTTRTATAGTDSAWTASLGPRTGMSKGA